MAVKSPSIQWLLACELKAGWMLAEERWMIFKAKTHSALGDDLGC